MRPLSSSGSPQEAQLKGQLRRRHSRRLYALIWTFTGRVKVLATGDHFLTWATSASMSAFGTPSHSMSTLTRTSVKPTGFSLTSPVPHTAVMLRSPSSSSSSLLTIQPRCTALACSPTARHEPNAASEASDGLGAVSSPNRPGGSSTMYGGRLGMELGWRNLPSATVFHFKVLTTLGLALPLAMSCSSPFLSIGARQPVSTVF